MTHHRVGGESVGGARRQHCIERLHCVADCSDGGGRRGERMIMASKDEIRRAGGSDAKEVL